MKEAQLPQTSITGGLPGEDGVEVVAAGGVPLEEPPELVLLHLLRVEVRGGGQQRVIVALEEELSDGVP